MRCGVGVEFVFVEGDSSGMESIGQYLFGFVEVSVDMVGGRRLTEQMVSVLPKPPWLRIVLERWSDWISGGVAMYWKSSWQILWCFWMVKGVLEVFTRIALILPL